jgi:DNA mismatch repair ATPase MutS
VEGVKASTSLKSFKSAIDLFNNRNNLLVAIAGNALFLWDIHTVSRLQKWVKTNQQSINNWIDVIYEMDAQISLATFVFNHPEYVFATMDKTENTFIDAQDLGHPLIAKAKCVTNSVQIDKKQFFIITGANMAGKSTFLRTIALSIVMSNCGLPVFASRFRYSPMKLITSMRSTDSLKDDESYFFSELKRLKYIVDIVQNEPYFIILDEILKGTNSKDKEEGSKKFVERLVNMSATGLIATHDLGLCTIESYLPQIKNYYFDAEIINDELHFDYTMKNGVCKNMNASFLLRKMNIVIS